MPDRPKRQPKTSVLGALAVAVIAVAGASLAGQSQAGARSQAEALARRAQERSQALRREADALANQGRTLLVELRRLEVERQLQVEELKRIEADHAKAAGELDSLNGELARLARTLEADRPQVAERLVELYKLGRAGYARLLLDVDDVRRFGQAYRQVSALAEIDRRRFAERRQQAETLRRTRWVLEGQATRIVQLADQARAAREQLDRAVAGRQNLIRSIDTKRDLNAQLAGELQVAQQRLQESLAAIAAGESTVVSLPLAPFRGDLDWPVRGPVIAAFGRSRSQKLGTSVVRNGIEVAAPQGTPVRVIHGGRVTFAGSFTGFGNLVIVDHGSQAYSLYGYLDSMTVGEGESVARGRVVGTVGHATTGPPALYFELRIDGKPVDPVEWLTR